MKGRGVIQADQSDERDKEDGQRQEGYPANSAARMGQAPPAARAPTASDGAPAGVSTSAVPAAPDPSPLPASLAIAIDGPAASGKSTLGYALANALGYTYFDSGVIYRALTWLALERGVDVNDEAALVALADHMDVRVARPEVDDGRQVTVLVNGHDVTWLIRSPEVDRHVSTVSAHPRVRAALTERLRQLASSGALVMVGRDIGTVVLPDAGLKLYLTASPEERARRRARELEARGVPADFQAILDDLRRRDARDAEREAAPMRPAADAVHLSSDGMRVDDEVQFVLQQLQASSGGESVARTHRQPISAAGAHIQEPSAHADGAAGQTLPASVGCAAVQGSATNVSVAVNDVPAREPTARVGSARLQEHRRTAMTPRARGFADRNPIWLTSQAVVRAALRSVANIQVSGMELCPLSGPVLLVLNHLSYVDIPLFGAWCPRMVMFFSKHEVQRWPVIGRIATTYGTIFVRRGESDRQAIREAMGLLTAGGVLAVFPEGHRSHGRGLLPGQAGIGLLAQRTGATVWPVAITGSELIGKQIRPRVALTGGVPFDPMAVAREVAGPDFSHQDVADAIMRRLAMLLPPPYRGAYADAAVR